MSKIPTSKEVQESSLRLETIRLMEKLKPVQIDRLNTIIHQQSPGKTIKTCDFDFVSNLYELIRRTIVKNDSKQ
jgi:hypothetical protein